MNNTEFGINMNLGDDAGSSSWSESGMDYGGIDSGNSWFYKEKSFNPGTVKYYFKAYKSGCSDVYDSNSGNNYSLTVTDDDSTAPTIVTDANPNGGTKGPMRIELGGTDKYTSGDNADRIFTVTDGDLRSLSVSSKLTFKFEAWDASGLSRNAGGSAAADMNYDIGTSILQNLFSTYISGSSAAGTSAGTSEFSVFEHSGAFLDTEVQNLYANTSEGSVRGKNKIRLSVPDGDYDNSRSADKSWQTDVQVGFLQVDDDDTAAPTFGTLSVNGGSSVTDQQIKNGGYNISLPVQDSGSGLNVNGTTVTGDDFSPNYDVLNNASATVINDRTFGTQTTDGGAKSSQFTMQDSAPAASGGTVDLGTYSVTVSATDNDEDRSSNDRTATINYAAGNFTVVDDDTTGPVIGAPTFPLFATASGTKTVSVSISDADSLTDESTVRLYYGYAPPYNQNHVDKATGTDNGTYTFTIPDQAGHEDSLLRFFIVASDDDNDRTGDAIQSVNNWNNDFYYINLYATEPATSPTGLTFSNVETGKMRIGWDNVSTKVLVVVKYLEDFTVHPTDGYSYYTDFEWAEAGPFDGALSRAMYDGPLTYVDIEGLSQGRTYYVRVYNYNGNNVPNYRTDGFLSGTQVTLDLEPSANPTVGAFTAVDTTSMTVNWSGGDGNEVIVVMREGGVVNADPVDGTTYSPNATFGSGSEIGSGNRVMYVGPGTSVPVTGLTPGAVYHVAVYALNGAAGSQNYLTTSPGTGNKSALCAAATLAAADGASTTDAGTSWNSVAGATSFGGSELKYRVYRDTDNDYAAATEFDTDSESYSDTTAAPGQLYYWWVRARNADNTLGPYSASDTGYRKLATVGSVDASDGTSTAHAQITWTDITGETGYLVYRHTANDSAEATQIGGTLAANTTSYDDTSASPGEQYYYWVKAASSSSSSTSGYSLSDGGYRKLPTVAGVTASDDTYSDKVAVSWTDSNAGETGYSVWRHTVDNSAGATDLTSGSPLDPNVTTFDDTTAVAGTPYYYWVRAVNSSSSSFSDFGASDAGRAALLAAPTVTTPTATSILVDGATLGATITTDGGASITDRGTTWGTVTPPVAHELSAGGTAVSAFSHARTGMPAGTLIYFIGWADNSEGRGESPIGSFWTVPEAPVPSAATSVATTSFSANWAAAVGATSYRLDVATDSGFGVGTFVSGYENKIVNDVTDSVIGLSAGGTYYYRVRAVNSGGTSANSGPITVYTLCTEPTAGGATSIGTDSFQANWESVGGAASYRLDVASDSLFASILGSYSDKTVAGLNDAVSSLSAGTPYWYRVRAVNAGGSPSANSATIGPVYTLSTEPASSPTGLTFSNVGTSAMRIGWGNVSTKVILVVKQSSDMTDHPLDGYTYGTDFDYSAGFGEYIGGGMAMYSGAGTYMDIEGLSAGYTYYVRVYNYNDSAPNYRTSDWLSGSQATLDLEPTASSTAMTFDRIQDTSVRVNWTSGDGANRIVVARAATAVNWTPTDGATPSGINGNFSSATDQASGNKVVYAGAGNNVTVSGLSAGTTYHFAVFEYNAGPNYLATALTGSKLTSSAPTAQSATADGNELVDLAWTPNGAYGTVMIVHKSGSAATAPIQGALYNVGATLDGGTVIYKGAGSSLEHQVGDGSDNYYQFYTVVNDYYTAAATATRAVGNYGATEIVEVFPYTNAVSLAGRNAGSGFSGGWTVDSGIFTAANGSFANILGYPNNGGSKVTTAVIGNGNNSIARRTLANAVSSGKIYVSAIMNFQYAGPDKFTGISFMDGSTEKIFFGDLDDRDPDAVDNLGINASGAHTYASYRMNEGAGEDYLVIGMYDFTTQKARVIAYYKNATVPAVEPAAGSWSESLPLAGITTINGIRLGAGASSGTPGDVYFDEVRVATSWADLMNLSSVVDPDAAAVAADGPQTVNLTWTKHGSVDVMIVHKDGSAPAGTPAGGTAYNVGDACAGGTVIYKGGGSALEHIVASGSANHYVFYSVLGTSYSTGLARNVTTPAYSTGEHVDPFAYTNGATLNGKGTGQGWGASTWTESTAGSFTINDGSFANISGYPANHGNKLTVNPVAGTTRTATRSFPAVTGGKLYVSFIMNFTSDGASQFAGVSFMDGPDEKLFFGELYGSDNADNLGADPEGAALPVTTVYDLNNGAGEDYLVVGMYDFATDTFKVQGYYKTDAVPTTEPASWIGSSTYAIDRIDGIRVGAGGTPGTPGACYFDEIRVGTSWMDVVGVFAPQTQATTILFSSVLHNQMGVSWTDGNGAGVLVVAREGVGAMTAPANGTAYSASTTFGVGTPLGSGYVVYQGAFGSFTLAGLTGNTTYQLQAYAYNGSGSDIRYNAASATGNPASQTTALPPTSVFMFR